MNNLQKQLASVMQVKTAKELKDVYIPKSNRVVISCREYRYFFGREKCGKCVLTTEEYEIISEAQGKLMSLTAAGKKELRKQTIMLLMSLRISAIARGERF